MTRRKNKENEAFKLPRPSSSTFSWITEMGLIPSPVSEMQDVIQHTVMLSEQLARDRRYLKMIHFAFILVCCLFLGCLILLFILYKIGHMCLC